MLNVDFHSHTRYSKDSLAPIEDVLAACRRHGIDRLVVTDHNSIQGALQAKELAPELVIVGEEIRTQAGELLAAFVSEEVPPDLPPMQAIELLRCQGAFISVSHPFDQTRNGHWDLPELMKIVPFVDAIEIYNSRCLWWGANRQAQQFARHHHLAGTAGSDAHLADEIGNAVLQLPDFHDPASLRAVIAQGKLVRSRWAGIGVHWKSTQARQAKKALGE